MATPDCWDGHWEAATERFERLSVDACHRYLASNGYAYDGHLDLREAAAFRWAQLAARQWRHDRSTK